MAAIREVVRRHAYSNQTRADEVDVFPSQITITYLADRIEKAYRRRYPHWRGEGVSRRVWALAAEGLCLLHRMDGSMPIDPELFVASVKGSIHCPDPWTELTPPSAFKRYRQTVRGLIRRLRGELDRELRRAEDALVKGVPLEEVMESRKRPLSPLGCYVLAHRADREDLLERFRSDAELQHLACPLYKEACSTLLPEGRYPEPTQPKVRQPLVEISHSDSPSFSLN